MVLTFKIESASQPFFHSAPLALPAPLNMNGTPSQRAIFYNDTEGIESGHHYVSHHQEILYFFLLIWQLAGCVYIYCLLLLY